MENLKVYEIDNDFLAKNDGAIIRTSKGDIKLTLFYKDAPQAVSNFIALANSGFYDGLKFHRVIDKFMAQGGCPHSKDNPRLAGTGGPGYRIKCEVENNPNKHKRGTISMAHAGRDTGGSQFFICFVDCPHLDGEHTTFGAISDEESFAVLDLIKQNDEIREVAILRKN
ncbi:peptidylprolyl isomerase [Helicobacter sp. 23-1044]